MQWNVGDIVSTQKFPYFGEPWKIFDISNGIYSMEGQYTHAEAGGDAAWMAANGFSGGYTPFPVGTPSQPAPGTSPPYTGAINPGGSEPPYSPPVLVAPPITPTQPSPPPWGVVFPGDPGWAMPVANKPVSGGEGAVGILAIGLGLLALSGSKQHRKRKKTR
jgi:hypothetical protein